MALTNQIHIYSVDTSAFYTEKEKKIAEPLGVLYKKRNEIKKVNPEKRTDYQKHIYKLINKRIGKIKENLKLAFIENESVRILDNNHIADKNIVSVFESTLTRTAEFEIDEITKDIIIVKAFYYDVLEDLICKGFFLDGEKYRIFTASAGQIRTKKTVFIKESTWEKHKDSLTCGLSIEKINLRGGINVNKYLAYLALTNSATDLWDDFDIDKCIVVDDFETAFETVVDYIDEKTYEIKPQTKRMIEIPHMDGCGIHLPKVNRKSFMIRMPWVKGLLVPFQYNSFAKQHIEENPNCAKIKDIYGKEYDIFKDDIQIIFTKSQFKMYKYYDSWDEYKENFKKFKCQAGVCNEEPNRIKNAKINYQMMQTLIDISDDELKEISTKLNEDIYNISRDRDTMLKVLGVHEFNQDKNYFQQALEIYPELLQDEHCRQILRDIRKKLVKEGKSARLPIRGKYTFIIPDLYAFCEWLFLGIENPNGLLKDGEVSCKIFSKTQELDVLRSPHLYMEHAVRKNIINQETRRWFITNGTYTSVHDPISRILQFDVDGDKSLTLEEPTIVNVAKRNVENNKVVPLYYDMAKAEPQTLSNRVFFEGMINAYSGGNIGAISNDITKIWNSEEVNLEVIKYLCMENNFVIDYAKTLYKPERPKDINKLIKSYTKAKTPNFFIYAKDKASHQVEDLNDCVVNRFSHIVNDVPFKFNSVALGKFDYKKLKNKNSRLIKKSDRNLIEKYNKLNKDKNKFDYDTNTYSYTYKRIKEELLEVNNDQNDVVDVLVEYLFPRKASKLLLFECFGDVIVENLKTNIEKMFSDGYIMCSECGKRFYRLPRSKSVRCDKCQKIKDRESTRNRVKKHRM